MSIASEYAARVEAADKAPKGFYPEDFSPWVAGVTKNGDVELNRVTLPARYVDAFCTWLKMTFGEEGT